MQFPRPPCDFSIPMKAERMNWCLAVIGWSRSELCERLDVPGSTVGQMTLGKRFIPNRLAVWLETLAELHMALPRPYAWDQKEAAAERHGQVKPASRDAKMLDTDFGRPPPPGTNALRRPAPPDDFEPTPRGRTPARPWDDDLDPEEAAE